MSTNALVTVKEGEPASMALKRLDQRLSKDGFYQDVKRHAFYVKPGDRLRRKRAIAAKWRRKKMARLMAYELETSRPRERFA